MRTLVITLVVALSFLSTALAQEKPRVIDYTVSAKARIVITVDSGSDEGVKKKKRGVLVDADGKRSECKFTVFHSTARKSKGKVKCTVAQVKANRFVEWLN